MFVLPCSVWLPVLFAVPVLPVAPALVASPALVSVAAFAVSSALLAAPVVPLPPESNHSHTLHRIVNPAGFDDHNSDKCNLHNPISSFLNY